MELTELQAGLEAEDLARDPDRWAIAAYRLALARSELATTPDSIHQCLQLLDKAARVLTADRAPLEHSRIQTARGNCFRTLGRSDLAAEAFASATKLLPGRGEPVEVAASLVNVGLAATEQGRNTDAVAALDSAIELLHRMQEDDRLADAPDSEWARTLGAAFVNRAQAHQGSPQARPATVAADYQAAIAVLAPASPQAAMAWHGLAATQLGISLIEPAIESLEHALAALPATSFPFQHAIARHSLAVALERRQQNPVDEETGDEQPGDEHDLARAVHHVEAALAIFDPRLHPAQWQTASTTLGRLEAQAGGAGRTELVVALLADHESVTEGERQRVLRDRLGRLVDVPPVRTQAELGDLCRVVSRLDPDRFQSVIEDLVSVLMELPDPVLDAACQALATAIGADEDRSRAVDTAIQQRLFGPQRVRVRDLLSAYGWRRP